MTRANEVVQENYGVLRGQVQSMQVLHDNEPVLLKRVLSLVEIGNSRTTLRDVPIWDIPYAGCINPLDAENAPMDVPQELKYPSRTIGFLAI